LSANISVSIQDNWNHTQNAKWLWHWQLPRCLT